MVLGKLQARLIHLPPRFKRLLIASCDSVVLLLILAATLALVGFRGWAGVSALLPLFPLTVVAGVPLLASQGLYRAIIRFIGAEMVFAMMRATAMLSATLAGMTLWMTGGQVRVSLVVGVLFWSLSAVTLTAGRLLMRAFVSRNHVVGDRVAIYGAGQAGVRLASAMANHREFMPVAFLDDNPQLQGRMVAGLPVVPPANLPVLVAELGVRRVLLAMPSVSRRVRQKIIHRLARFPVHVQTVPDIGDLLRGNARVEDLREVGTLDLLGREPVPPDEKLLSSCITGKSVMVTGAGGSIGSELCRQIVQLRPRRLVLFEQSELHLYSIDRELRNMIRADGLGVELVPLLGSVHHRRRIGSVMRAFQVQTVYHAAAYKHVPIVEANVVEGIHNNVVGTWYAAEAAEAAGVEVFVLVSTDKAVKPANVMGATKRMAELVLQGIAGRGSRTRFCMVRFGNVLESSGSVVPLFREQIRQGGPVTVTDPDVIRYFMTIPEAAQLVIQAGSLGQGGDVFVLDMGEPVRIADLARRMIHLMGLTVRDEQNPEGDIAIEYTGLRPGEKLYEELLIGGEVVRTDHPMIMQAFEESIPWNQLRAILVQLVDAADAMDIPRALRCLMDSVTGYRPVSSRIEDLVWQAGEPADVPPKVAGGEPVVRLVSAGTS